jgi:hypothetical protein
MPAIADDAPNAQPWNLCRTRHHFHNAESQVIAAQSQLLVSLVHWACSLPQARRNYRCGGNQLSGNSMTTSCAGRPSANPANFTPSVRSLILNALARSSEGELHCEPWRNPARTQPRPPGITQSRLGLCRDWSRAQRANGSAGIARSIINSRKSDRGYSGASADSVRKAFVFR